MPINIEEMGLKQTSSQEEMIQILDGLKYNESYTKLAELASLEQSYDSNTEKLHQKIRALAKTRLNEALAIFIAKLSVEEIDKIINMKHPSLNWIYGHVHIEIYSLIEICKIQILLKKSATTLPPITLGPLEKNQATEYLQYIYENAILVGCQFNINQRNEIIVNVADKEFNLTYLLGEADLTQFRLDKNNDEVVSSSSSSSASEQRLNQSNQLAETEIIALQSYTGHEYDSINTLLRTGKVSYNVADLFFKSCLIANVLNKLSNEHEFNLLKKYETAKDLFLQSKNIESCADRDYISDITQFAQQKNIMTLAECNQFVEFHFLGSLRKANYAPENLAYNEGFMSSAKGRVAPSPLFAAKRYLVWSNHGKSIRAYSQHDNEAETLVASGQQHYFESKAGITIAHLVNTPSLRKPSDYSWLRAVQVAYDEYLSKPFKDSHLCSSDLKYQDVERPNHGLAHTMRTIIYLDAVIDFFVKHAVTKEEREVLNTLSSEEREKLKIVLAFYVTGRQSEVSWLTHANDTLRYRDASIQFLKKYVKNDSNWTSEDIEKYSKLLEYHKEKSGDLKQDTLYNVVLIAHKFDLARCYNASQMNQIMNLCFPNGGNDHEVAKSDWIKLKKWSIERIKATGDRLFNHVNKEGEYVADNQSYDDTKFIPASKDPLACHKILSDIPTLDLSEAPKVKPAPVTQVAHFQFQESVQAISYSPSYQQSASAISASSSGISLNDEYYKSATYEQEFGINNHIYIEKKDSEEDSDVEFNKMMDTVFGNYADEMSDDGIKIFVGLISSYDKSNLFDLLDILEAAEDKLIALSANSNGSTKNKIDSVIKKINYLKPKIAGYLGKDEVILKEIEQYTSNKSSSAITSNSQSLDYEFAHSLKNEEHFQNNNIAYKDDKSVILNKMVDTIFDKSANEISDDQIQSDLEEFISLNSNDTLLEFLDILDEKKEQLLVSYNVLACKSKFTIVSLMINMISFHLDTGKIMLNKIGKVLSHKSSSGVMPVSLENDSAKIKSVRAQAQSASASCSSSSSVSQESDQIDFGFKIINEIPIGDLKIKDNLSFFSSSNKKSHNYTEKFISDSLSKAKKNSNIQIISHDGKTTEDIIASANNWIKYNSTDLLNEKEHFNSFKKNK
ncbi:MAG: SidE phosphodiesterase domain-containing protein [Gammaproteobacteria bacterium]|nr:SidE phosphodiesterase domain-containing protein [Gammaproteobacteria bacterium]